MPKYGATVSYTHLDVYKRQTLADIKRWSEYTQSKFQYYLFRGGHFFIKEDEENVLKLIHQKSEEFINREN